MGSVLSHFESRHSLTTSISHKVLTTMTDQERVKSKNLFNFRPQGFIDPEVVFYDEKMKADFGLDPVAMEEEMKSQNEAEFVKGMRDFMGGFLAETPFSTDPAYLEAHASCDNTVLEVPTKHDGEYNVKVLVHAPKSLALQTCTKASSPIWPLTAGSLCSMLTTDLHRRPGVPTMCSTFMRQSSMCQPTQPTLALTLQGSVWQARVEEGTSALVPWSSSL